VNLTITRIVSTFHIRHAYDVIRLPLRAFYESKIFDLVFKETVISEQRRMKTMTEDGNQRIECRRADGTLGEYRTGYSGSGMGYNQSCGGWENLETGQIYAIANWGNKRHWEVNSISHVDESNNVTTNTSLRHGWQAQMEWWFNENDVDVTKLVPIKFSWKDAPVGQSYTIEEGPQQGHNVPESLPCEITRPFMHAVKHKMYYGENGKLHEGVQGDVNWLTPVQSIVKTWEEHQLMPLPTEEKMNEMMNTMPKTTTNAVPVVTIPQISDGVE